MTTGKFLYLDNAPQKKVVSEIPWMDQDGLILFKNLANKSQCYLEFGAGGSTLHMIKNTNTRHIVSVDSDKEWVKNINECVDSSQKHRLHIEHCNIGPVGAWGVPRNQSHIDNYWRYMSMPWEYVEGNFLIPDLILIDGRFRVACFLYSLLCAKLETTILFDDYTERPEYFIVEKFCKLNLTAGRMALFKVSKEYSIPEICKVITQYSVVPD